MKDAYSALFKTATSDEVRFKLNNTKIIFNNEEVRKKYDAFLVSNGLNDGKDVPGIQEAGNNLGVETVPAGKKIKKIAYDFEGESFEI